MSAEKRPATPPDQEIPYDAIASERVLLRPKRQEDVADDYAWRCDEELSRFDAVQPLKAPFESFRKDFDAELRSPGPYRRRFGVDTLEGHHIGNCSFYNIDFRRKETELGIMIGDKAYWNNGYGTEIVSTLLTYIFRKTALTRVYLYVLAWNHRAQRCFAKAGFVERRRTREIGHDFVVMDISRDQFDALSAGGTS